MRWTRFRILMLILTFVIGSVLTVALMLRHEPEFYRRAAIPAGHRRFEISHNFLADLLNFYGAFKGADPWKFEFTQEKLNSYFDEHFASLGDEQDWFGQLGISNLRVEFNEKQIRLGFRYSPLKAIDKDSAATSDLKDRNNVDPWSTVLSYDLKVWLVPSEMNVLAIEIERRRAGALPIPNQHIFQELKDLGRRHHIDIDWYRHNGNPVAIVKFQGEKPRPDSQLRRLEISPGKLELQGTPFDPLRNPLEPIKKAPVQISRAS
jgi:hypothetical protein